MITCNPWKPVATKKVEPNTESAIVKDASKYSKACSAVKYRPNSTVIVSLWIAWWWLSSKIAWWAHVAVAPEDNKIIVFKRGIWKGLNGEIPLGGQSMPISTVGDNLEWKKAQKKEKKNKTSEIINKIIPHRKPVTTVEVCKPW